MRHLDNLVVKNGLIAGCLCAVLIFALGWTGWVLSPLHQGRLRADKNIEYAAAMINVEMDRAERTALGLRAIWRQQPQNIKDPSRIATIQPFLDHRSLIKSVIMSRADGESLFIKLTPDAWEMILIAPGAVHPTISRAVGGQWLQVPSQPFQRTFDPRERPWYRLAEAGGAPAWTRPYRFTEGGAGFTYAVPVTDGARLEGVVGVDVALELLERRVADLLPGSEFSVLVTDAEGRTLVSPGDKNHPLLAPPPPGLLERFSLAGPFRYQRRLPLRVQAPAMELRVAVAPGVLVPGLRQRMVLVALAAVLSFAAVMGYVHFLNRNLVRPIMHLLGQAEPAPGPSRIWEFEQLEDAIRRLGQTEADRQQILQQLEHAQRVETMGNMAPGVIHDLNNHLSVILAQLNLCMEEGDGTATLQRRIGKAERATMRCAQAMRGLLEYSRPGRPTPVAFILNELIQNAVVLLEPVLGETIQVETTLGEGMSPLFGEPVKLQQVVVNLALNARDAMRGCGVLSFRTWTGAGGACLEVRDTGCGMTEEVKRKVFEPFFSTKEAGKGTGLGLTMVQRIVSAHGGTIDVASEPGEGTRFVIHLPVEEACAEPAPI